MVFEEENVQFVYKRALIYMIYYKNNLNNFEIFKLQSN